MDAVDSPTFAALLRRLRVAAGLTQEELAERANLSVRGVSDLERGLRTAPRRDTVDFLAEALDLTPADRAQLVSAVSRRRGPTGPISTLPLPAEPTPLIGREQDEARAIQFIRWDGIRLLTLTGPGGVGKTRLAVGVARSLADDFSLGVSFVPLASVSDPALVPADLAESLGVREQAGQPIEESLIAHLQNRMWLLVLDNFEHLIPAAPFLSQLLAVCPRVTALVTSRAPLHLRLEQEMEVQPLAVPLPSSLTSLGDAVRSPAVTLFVQRARAVRPEYNVSEADARTVAEICYHLDGLPLALELAAARIKFFPPHDLLQRLAHPLTLLTGGATDQPLRQQTLRNTIEWSYSLLDEEEQALFTRFSVFAGGCTLDATEAVCNSDGRLDLLQGMSSLIDKSLVRREGDEESRFTMLETIRQFAAEKLVKRGDTECVKAEHARYFLGLCESAAPELLGVRQAERLAQLERELDNIRSALAWLRERGRIEEGLRLASALFDFWRMNGHWSEGFHWLEEAFDRSGSIAVPIRARALARAGALSGLRDEHEPATEGLEEALVLARRVGDRREIAWVLRNLAVTTEREGNQSRTAQLVEESLHICREVGDSQGIAENLIGLGSVAMQRGDSARAESCFRGALSLFRELGDRTNVAATLNNLGYTLMEKGEYKEARASLEESVQHLRALGVRGELAPALDSLGCAEHLQGDLERATALFSESLALCWELEERWLVPFVLGHMAELAVEKGRAVRAARLAGAEAAWREATEMPSTLPDEQEDLERAMRRAREDLGMDTFCRAWEEGHAMSLGEAIEYALDRHGVG